jgi:hypothetical protein
MVGDPASKRLKVAILSLFHPTASRFHIATQPFKGGLESKASVSDGKSFGTMNRPDYSGIGFSRSCRNLTNILKKKLVSVLEVS